MKPIVCGREDGSVSVRVGVDFVLINKANVEDVAAEMLIASNPKKISRDATNWICHRILDMSRRRLNRMMLLSTVAMLFMLATLFFDRLSGFTDWSMGLAVGMMFFYNFLGIHPHDINKLIRSAVDDKADLENSEAD